jgi:hypothetical protein
MTSDNSFLQNRLIQTGQTGGQLYSDASPLVFPGRMLSVVMQSVVMLNVMAPSL